MDTQINDITAFMSEFSAYEGMIKGQRKRPMPYIDIGQFGAIYRQLLWRTVPDLSL
jgi:hypothetical protein